MPLSQIIDGEVQVEDVFPVAACHFAVPAARLETIFWQWRTYLA